MVAIIAAGTALGYCSAGWSKEKTPEGPQQVVGTISHIGKDYISVVTKTDTTDPKQYREEEVLVPFTEAALTFSHTAGLSDLKYGDTVSVEYVEEEQQFGDQTKIRRRGKGISLIKSNVENTLASE